MRLFYYREQISLTAQGRILHSCGGPFRGRTQEEQLIFTACHGANSPFFVLSDSTAVGIFDTATSTPYLASATVQYHATCVTGVGQADV